MIGLTISFFGILIGSVIGLIIFEKIEENKTPCRDWNTCKDKEDFLYIELKGKFPRCPYNYPCMYTEKGKKYLRDSGQIERMDEMIKKELEELEGSK